MMLDTIIRLDFLQNLARVYLRIQLFSILPLSTAPTPWEHLYLIESDLRALLPYADGTPLGVPCYLQLWL
jgi:hypothetical protein